VLREALAACVPLWLRGRAVGLACQAAAAKERCRRAPAIDRLAGWEKTTIAAAADDPGVGGPEQKASQLRAGGTPQELLDFCQLWLRRNGARPRARERARRGGEGDGVLQLGGVGREALEAAGLKHLGRGRRCEGAGGQGFCMRTRM
jgi:hypothetical protein